MLLWCRFDPWPRNFPMRQVCPHPCKKGRKWLQFEKRQTWMLREGSLTLIQEGQVFRSVYQTDSGNLFTVKGSLWRLKDEWKNKRIVYHQMLLFQPLPLPQHHQSLAVTHLHFPVWMSCLSSSHSDEWNWTGLTEGSWPDERGFLGDHCRLDPAAFTKRQLGCRASQTREEWVPPSLTPSVPVPRPNSNFISDVQELRRAFVSGRFLLLFLCFCF